MSENAAPDILHEDDVEASVEEHLEQAGKAGFTSDAIANASVAHALNATFSDTEVEAALDALGGKVNAILDALRANGTVAEA